MIALAEPWIEGFGWLVSDGAAVFFAKWEDGSILDEAPPPAVKRVFAMLQTETLFPAKKNFMLGVLLYCYPSLSKENSSLFDTAEGKENRTTSINSVTQHVAKELRQANEQTKNVKEKKAKRKRKIMRKKKTKKKTKKISKKQQPETQSCQMWSCFRPNCSWPNVFVSKQPFEKLMHLSLREEGAAVWQRGSKREGDGGKEEKEEEEGEDDDEDDDEKKEEEYEYE